MRRREGGSVYEVKWSWVGGLVKGRIGEMECECAIGDELRVWSEEW